MWKLSEIRINNIISFHEASFVIEQDVATLIFGKNEDNASQPCNGSGKSSLIEAISFALTGEQLRKVKSVEEIINDHEDSAYVYLKLFNDYNNTTFTIERTISRSAAQCIECHKYDEFGKEIEKDKTIQPTVSDYNKFILNEIGLSKDDIYSNYILCDNKYESFFDCSDKNKKEIINRFSNGVIVDEGIERVIADMEPVKNNLVEANSNVLKIKGSISAIEYELSTADEKKANAEQERLNRANQLDAKINECRENIESTKNKVKEANDRLEILNDILNEISDMEDSDMSLVDSYNAIKSMFKENNIDPVDKYDEELENYKENIAICQNKIQDAKVKIEESEKHVKQYTEEYEAARKKYMDRCENEKKQVQVDDLMKKKIQDELDRIDDKLDELEKQIKSGKKQHAELSLQIHTKEKLLGDCVTCPNCSHKFSIVNNCSYEQISDEIKALNKDLNSKAKEINDLDKAFETIDNQGIEKEDELRKLENNIKERAAQLDSEYYELKKLSEKCDTESNALSNLKRISDSHNNALNILNGKIDVLRNRLFGEATGIMERRIMNGNNYVDQHEESITFMEGQLKQYQDAKKTCLEAAVEDFTVSLKSSLKTYKEELKQAENTLNEHQAEFDKLKQQEMDFTVFKSYLARKKIDALSLIVNDFLEKIGSDIRLKLEGFTVTKTGKLRDKISVQVMRDGIDCGSYQKFSGGEKARLNLACILSLHTLTNSNCEDGKGLDFIIIDELLDKSDEMGMTTYCDALNKLGQTSLLITQGGVSEGYPHKLLIVKKQGISSIQKNQ